MRLTEPSNHLPNEAGKLEEYGIEIFNFVNHEYAVWFRTAKCNLSCSPKNPVTATVFYVSIQP